MSNFSEEDLLDELNQQKAVDYIPISVYIGVLFVTGVIGNLYVISFYSDKTRITPTTRLIFLVAIIDELICILMPETFAELTVPYDFTSTVFCKGYYFTNYLLCLWESYVLLAIGVFRYRKICLPFKRQFTVKHAKYAGLLTFAAGILITFPTAIFFRSVPVPVTVHGNITITGYECNTSIDSLQTVQLVHNIMVLTNLLTLAVLLLVLYGLTVRSLRKHNTKIGLLEAKTNEIGHTAVKRVGDNTNTNDERADVSNENDERAHRVETFDHANHKLDKHHTHGLQKIPPGMTTMLFVITIIFILSYLPYVALTIISSITEEKYRSTRSNWIQFVSQSYRLNSVFNPFVYGYYNKEFRKFVSEKTCKIAKCVLRKK